MRAGSGCNRPEHAEHEAFDLGLALESLTREARRALRISLSVAADAAGTSRAMTRSLGLVAHGPGFEVYAGGTARRAGHKLGRARNGREAIEYICGFIQLYREERAAREGVARFLARVSPLYARERLAKDPLGRSLLAGRFLATHGPRGEDPPKNCAFSVMF